MKKVFIILSIISYLIGRTNPIDIATTGANKLRMYGQLNIFQNPATLGFHLDKIKLDSSLIEVSLNDFNENLGLSDKGKYIFICRSGIRSNFAALTVEESFNSGNYKGRCFNVEDGFEGYEQPSAYPQNPIGWKNWGLPWSRVN